MVAAPLQELAFRLKQHHPTKLLRGRWIFSRMRNRCFFVNAASAAVVCCCGGLTLFWLFAAAKGVVDAESLC